MHGGSSWYTAMYQVHCLFNLTYQSTVRLDTLHRPLLPRDHAIKSSTPGLETGPIALPMLQMMLNRSREPSRLTGKNFRVELDCQACLCQLTQAKTSQSLKLINYFLSKHCYSPTNAHLNISQDSMINFIITMMMVIIIIIPTNVKSNWIFT